MSAERKITKAREKIGAALNARTAQAALREQATVNTLAQTAARQSVSHMGLRGSVPSKPLQGVSGQNAHVRQSADYSLRQAPLHRRESGECLCLDSFVARAEFGGIRLQRLTEVAPLASRNGPET
jgi:hypothetical protein